MTEEEARKKWCPFSRLVVITENGQSAAMNRVVLGEGTEEQETVTPCIASDCMAWRWLNIDQEYKFGPSDDEGKMKVLQSPITKFGYCGLAGK